MKTMKFYLAIAVSVLLFAACSSDDAAIDNGKNDLVEVKFTSEISANVKDTKAANTTWNIGDEIGVFMINAGQPLATANISNGANNKTYVTRTGKSSFSAFGTEIVYFPTTSSDVDFISYYPRKATGTAAGQINNFVFPVNISNQSSQAAIDLLYSNNAKGYNKSSSVVNLQFTHMLSKLVIDVVPGNGLTAADLSNMSIKISGMNTVASFDLATGTLSAPVSPADLSLYAAAIGIEYEAIILPQQIVPASPITVHFALNNTANDVFTWTIPNGTIFKSAEKNIYTVTISKTGVQITGIITDWTTGAGGAGVAL